MYKKEMMFHAACFTEIKYWAGNFQLTNKHRAANVFIYIV